MIVLVHGAWHDASCWADVVAAIEARGVRALAVDLPIEDPANGATAYARAIIDAIEANGTGERVTLVGHSLAGLVAPVAVQELGPGRVDALVLVAPLLPEPGLSLRDAVSREPDIHAMGPGQTRIAPRVTAWTEPAATRVLYAGVSDELVGRRGLTTPDADARVRRAVERLRPQGWTIDVEVTPLLRWPEVPTTVIVCEADRVLSPHRMRERARRLVPGRVVELPGGHFPLVTAPERLAELIVGAASARPEPVPPVADPDREG